MSNVIAGVNWVTANHVKPAAANMSLGGPKSAILDSAVLKLAKAGVFVAISAGNDGVDACNVSPARVGPNNGLFTTAASSKTDARAVLATWSSNHGKCVDGYAPGVAIKSAWKNSGTAILGGTSMAAPHVAGVAAILKQLNPSWSPTSIEIWIKWAATAGVITGNPAGTPNRLLYKGTI
jgi:subtilisin family serine protease